MTITSEVFQMVVDVLNAKPAPKHVDRIRALIHAGKCLLCEETATRRGLCTNHYFAFRRARAGKSEAECQEIETRAVRSGKLLPRNYSRQVKRPNPFLEG